MNNAVAQVNEVVLLIGPDSKRFYVRLKPDYPQNTHLGVINHNQIIGQPLGCTVASSTGHHYLVIEPSLDELMKEVRRKSQIIYPKEAGRIVLKLNVYPGRHIIEAGSGSGALTFILARLVAPGGRVYSYEVRNDMLLNARANIEQAGLSEIVDFKLRNIAEGFAERDVDAVFLDVKDPWRFLPQVKAALKPGGFFGAIVPTTNQISDLLLALKGCDFGGVEVEENFIRTFKPMPGRLRPDDVMVGHTGYLVFARNVMFEVQASSRRRKAAWQHNQPEED